MSECPITDCGRPAKCRGLCKVHYMRLVRHGDPLADIPVRITDPKTRLLSKIALVDGCWIWQGQFNRKGYGVTSHKDRKIGAYRLSYLLFVGPIANGLQIDHLCRTPACINPEHLEAVTQAENMRRRSEAYTHCNRGHAYTPENTYRNPNSGKRFCRECIRIRSRQWRMAKSAQ